MLRKLKRHVYDLVLTDDPKEQIYVTDLAGGQPADDLDVVFGVGIKEKIGVHGYVGLERQDLVDEAVRGTGEHDPHLIVSEVLPRVAKGASNFPLFRYLRGADLLTKEGKIRANSNVDQRVAAAADRQRGRLPVNMWTDRKAAAALQGITSVNVLRETQKPKDVLNYITYLPESKVAPEDIRAFLQSHPELAKVNKVQYVKVVCFLDWLEFGKG